MKFTSLVHLFGKELWMLNTYIHTIYVYIYMDTRHDDDMTIALSSSSWDESNGQKTKREKEY